MIRTDNTISLHFWHRKYISRQPRFDLPSREVRAQYGVLWWPSNTYSSYIAGRKVAPPFNVERYALHRLIAVGIGRR